MKKRTNEKLEANHCGFFGTTGSGKTHWLLRHPAWDICKRSLMWDPEGSLKASTRIRSADALKRFYNGHRAFSKSFNAAFTPDIFNEENFELFCQVCFKLGHAANPLLVAVEELADVARVGKASPYWGQLSRKGRKYGTTILYASQKPQEIDKTIIDQSAVLASGMLKTARPRKYMAELLDVSYDEFKAINKKDFYFRRDADPAVFVKYKQKIPKNFTFLAS